MLAVQTSISTINSVLNNIDASALASLEPRVSALEIRVAVVSAATSVNAAAITSINNAVSAALTSLNASNLTTGLVPTARLASGTANSTTFLRGDRTWAVPTSGGGGGGGTGETFNAFLLMGG
jgi:hypothetical protein